MDEAIMPLIQQANIACGFHASDPLTMSYTVALAVKHNVQIGAHPGYPDLVGFGRRSIPMSHDELVATVMYQIGALAAICASHHTLVSYVKPHGALYNDMMKNTDLFSAICQAVKQSNVTDVLMVQALPDMSAHQEIAQQHGLRLLFEAFADRHYQDSGLLVNRSQDNAVLKDAKQVSARIEHYQKNGTLLSENGVALNLEIDSFCVHGDNEHALTLVKQLHRQFAT